MATKLAQACYKAQPAPGCSEETKYSAVAMADPATTYFAFPGSHNAQDWKTKRAQRHEAVKRLGEPPARPQQPAAAGAPGKDPTRPRQQATHVLYERQNWNEGVHLEHHSQCRYMWTCTVCWVRFQLIAAKLEISQSWQCTRGRRPRNTVVGLLSAACCASLIGVGSIFISHM